MDRLIEIQDELVREALETTGASTEREAIELAVKSFVSEHRKSRKRKSMFDLVGDVRLRDDYDYKSMRAGDASD